MWFGISCSYLGVVSFIHSDLSGSVTIEPFYNCVGVWTVASIGRKVVHLIGVNAHCFLVHGAEMLKV